jgi:hypothetical protein
MSAGAATAARGGDGAHQTPSATTGDHANVAARTARRGRGIRTRRPPPSPDVDRETEVTDPENSAVDLGRVAWLATVFGCLIAVVTLLFEGYYGYAAVTFAVALSAGINLL